MSNLLALGIKLYPEKYEILKSSVEHLVHRIGKNVLYLIESKIKEIIDIHDPENVNVLRFIS